MIKKTITYTDYNGEERTEDFYFNIDEREAIRMELKYKGGIEGHLKRIQMSEDNAEIYNLFETLVLDAYGKRFPDGGFYKKDPETGRLYRVEFEASRACTELIVELMTNAEDGGRFLAECLPEKMREAARAEAAKAGAPSVPGEVVTPSRPKWMEEEREPTKQELMAMNKDEMLQAMMWKDELRERKAQTPVAPQPPTPAGIPSDLDFSD